MQPNPERARVLLRLRLAVASAALFAACATEPLSSAHRVDDLVAHGRFEEAVRLAASIQAKEPGNARAEQIYKDASVAYLLEQGRRLTFSNRDEEALEVFQQAQAIEPSSPIVASWVDKTKRKMAEHWLEIAQEAYANQDLDSTMDAYEKALEYSPGDPSAVSGLASSALQANLRMGRGEDYFKEGLQALSRYWLDQARSRFMASHKYLPKDQRTEERKSQVAALIADQRVVVGKRLESERHYAAARNEYRIAIALDPENEDAKAGQVRAKNEADAGELVRAAKLATMRGKFDKANEDLDKGRALTEAQQDLFDGARADVEQAVFEQHYQNALALERDLQFEAAVQAYAELLQKTPYYKDVLTRKETLEHYIHLADELYAKYVAAASHADKLMYLQQISVFWPEYKDTRARLEELEAGAH